MTDIEQKALALVNEVFRERGHGEWIKCTRKGEALTEALCRAIEQHEAFRQEVSDAAVEYNEHGAQSGWLGFDHFIAKPLDPLAECLLELDLSKDGAEARHDAKWLVKTVEKRGGKIVWGEG